MSRDVLERMEKAVDLKTGLITSVYQIATEPDDPHLFYYNAVLSHAARYAPLPVAWRRIQGGGVGRSREEAMIAAIGECFERYCPMIYSEKELRLSKFSQLRKEGIHAVSPCKFSLFSQDQYKTDEFLFKPPDDESAIAWIWGYSLTDDEPILVPAAFVFLPYVYPYRNQKEIVITPSISTGLACRDTIGSAVLYGLLEVIERDALTLTWFNKIPASEIFLNHVKLKSTLKRVSHMNGKFHFLDITTDIGIPVVLVLAFFPYSGQPAAVAGASCRPTLKSAALKSLIEACQQYPVSKWLMHTNSQYVYKADFSDVIDFDNHVHYYTKQENLNQFDFLFNEKEKKHKELFGDDTHILKKLITLFKEKEMDVIAVNVTTPDIEKLGFYVARVVVPQLQPLNGDYRFRFLGGKRLSSYNCSQEVNIYPHPFP